MSDKEHRWSWGSELLWEDGQLQEAIARYPGLMANPNDGRRIMISTDDVWGGSWSPVHDARDELSWSVNPSLEEEAS